MTEREYKKVLRAYSRSFDNREWKAFANKTGARPLSQHEIERDNWIGYLEKKLCP